MDQEHQHLLSKRGFNTSSESSPAKEGSIQEQSLVQDLRQQILVEREANAVLSRKVDKLNHQFERLNNKYVHDALEKNKEIEKLKRQLEALNESHAATADEFRFQVESLRNKIDPKKNQENDTEDKKRHKTKSPLSHDKFLKRQNSNDSLCSLNSNPCFSIPQHAVQRGEFMWRINGFAKKLKRICSGQYEDPLRSDPFITGPSGYRLSGWAYLNGRGKGLDRYLSVYIRVMAGEHDPILPWPIKPTYTITLICQESEESKRYNLVRTRDLSVKHPGICRPQKEDKAIIVGFDDFIEHEDLEKKHFVVDDCLFLKLVVEIPPPI